MHCQLSRGRPLCCCCRRRRLLRRRLGDRGGGRDHAAGARRAHDRVGGAQVAGAAAAPAAAAAAPVPRLRDGDRRAAAAVCGAARGCAGRRCCRGIRCRPVTTLLGLLRRRRSRAPSCFSSSRRRCCRCRRRCRRRAAAAAAAVTVAALSAAVQQQREVLPVRRDAEARRVGIEARDDLQVARARRRRARGAAAAAATTASAAAGGRAADDARDAHRAGPRGVDGALVGREVEAGGAAVAKRRGLGARERADELVAGRVVDLWLFGGEGGGVGVGRKRGSALGLEHFRAVVLAGRRGATISWPRSKGDPKGSSKRPHVSAARSAP